MDGYVMLVRKGIEVSLLLLSLMKEGLSAFLPETLRKSVKLAWSGMVGVGNWMGYGLAAIYYLGLEFKFADIMCTVFGYVDLGVGTMHKLVDFAKPLAAMLNPKKADPKKAESKEG